MKKACFIGILLILLTLSLHSAVFCQSQDTRLKNAQILMTQGEFQKALDILKKLVELEPMDVDVQYLLGLAYKGTGDLDNARIHLQKAYNILPDSDAVAVQLASVMMEKDDSEGAKKILSDCIIKNPGSAILQYAMGVLYYNRQDVPTAVSFFNQAVVKNKSFCPALANLGYINYNQDNPEKAVEFYDKAALLEPQNPEYPFASGWVMYNSGNKLKAYQYFSISSALSPPTPYSAMEKALKAYDENSPDKAREALTEVFNMDKDFSRAYVLLARLDLSEKKFEDAEKNISHLLKEDPLDRDALNLQKQLQEAKNQPTAP